MKTSSSSNTHRVGRLLLSCLALFLLITSGSCNFTTDEDESLEKTQTALSAEQTALAEEGDQGVEATIAAQQATIEAQSVQQTAMAQQQPAQQTPDQPPAPDLSATQEALAAQQTRALAHF